MVLERQQTAHNSTLGSIEASVSGLGASSLANAHKTHQQLQAGFDSLHGSSKEVESALRGVVKEAQVNMDRGFQEVQTSLANLTLSETSLESLVCFVCGSSFQ